jgi:drug/metabolite transporter (DMT)-like permease
MGVYSADRANRLRWVLAIVVALGVLAAVLAAFVLADEDHRAAGIFALVAAGLLLASSGTALKLLRDADQRAKPASVITGVVCVLAGIGLAGTWLALLLPLLGLGLLFLALVSDDPHRSA